MNGLRQSVKHTFFTRLPADFQQEFQLDSIRKNNWRFHLLPYLNILTQMICYIIYLYIYPTTFPERPRLDHGLFTVFSLFYLAGNVLFIALFQRARSMDGEQGFVRYSRRLLIAFLVFYIAMEGIETVLEVEISGNIYRFLATFFVVTFLPILPRVQKGLLLTYYAVLVEAGLGYLILNGYPNTNRFTEILILFYLVCIVLANVVYTNTLNSFALNQELIEANRKLQYLTVTDPLTNIANRRAFTEYIGRIWDECKRNGHAVNLMMIDIDWFKLYNDHCGHQKGDDCLEKVAGCLRDSFTRSLDMVARYGGEEFVVLLPYTDAKGVAYLAENVRRQVEELGIENPAAESGRITISVGVASMAPGFDSRVDELIKQADDALYLAKKKGRNCVCFADGHLNHSTA